MNKQTNPMGILPKPECFSLCRTIILIPCDFSEWVSLAACSQMCIITACMVEHVVCVIRATWICSARAWFGCGMVLYLPYCSHRLDKQLLNIRTDKMSHLKIICIVYLSLVSGGQSERSSDSTTHLPQWTHANVTPIYSDVCLAETGLVERFIN